MPTLFEDHFQLIRLSRWFRLNPLPKHLFTDRENHRVPQSKCDLTFLEQLAGLSTNQKILKVIIGAVDLCILRAS